MCVFECDREEFTHLSAILADGSYSSQQTPLSWSKAESGAVMKRVKIGKRKGKNSCYQSSPKI